MRLRTISQLAIVLAFCACGYTGKLSAAEQTLLRVTPSTVTLHSPESRQQLLVETTGPNRFQRDATRDAVFTTSDPHIASVTDDGRVFPQAEGATTITIQVDDHEVKIPVIVNGLLQPRPVSFRHEVLPILTKASCNSGGCHGKAEGQNGFKLSIFGFDPEADHAALVKESRGRRVSLAAPESSLLLLKAMASTPHGGGAKIETNGIWNRRLVRWVAEGAELDDIDGPRVTSIEVSPSQIVMRPNSQQQIQVTAIDSTGHRQGVDGPILPIPAGATEVLYPCYIPEWLETDRTTRMVVLGVGWQKDPLGNIREVTKQADARITMILEGALLQVAHELNELTVNTGETFEVPFAVSRSAKLPVPVKLQMITPVELRPFIRLEPESIDLSPNETQGKLRVITSKHPALVGRWPLTIKATALQDGRWLVVAQTELSVQFNNAAASAAND